MQKRGDISLKAKERGVSRQAMSKAAKRHGGLDAALKHLEPSEVTEQTRLEKLRLTKAQADKAEMEAAERRGQLVEAATVLAARDAADAVLFAVLDGRLSETCAKLSGLPADQQEAHWRRVIAEVKELARVRYEELANA